MNAPAASDLIEHGDVSAKSGPTCRVCGGPVPYQGRGRAPSTCSPAHRLQARATDARTRRASASSDEGTPSADSANASRIRAGLRTATTERTAAYDDRLKGLATPADLALSEVDPHEPAPNPGFATVRADRRGRTVWDSDAALHRRTGYAAKEAIRIRAACVQDSIRDALADARHLGIFDPKDVDLEPARERGNARADAIIAALAA